MTYGYSGKFTAVPGQRDALATMLLDASHDMDGCLLYVVSVSDEDDIWVWEAWTDKDAHDASLEQPDVQAHIEAARPLIADMSDNIETTVLGGSGMASPPGNGVVTGSPE